MKHLRITYAIVCLAWLTCACQDNTKFHQYQPVKQTGWCSIDTLTFHLPSKMDCGEYDMQIGIRHTEKYAYQDIWLEMTCACDSTMSAKDTLHLYLATKNGEWSGRGIGGLIQSIHAQAKPLPLQPTEQGYIIRITHLMNDSTLQGIHDIGVQLSLRH